MALNIIPEVRPREAQTTPADLHLAINLAEFRSGLRHLAGGVSMACIAVAVTAGLIGTAFVNGQFEAIIFAGFTAVTAYWMTVYSLAVGNLLFSRYKVANSDNMILRRHLRRCVEGEAGDGAGDTVTSPASKFKVIPFKGDVH